MKAKNKFSAAEMFALAFGIFLGLCIWKFGNPVILDHKIIPPKSAADFWNDAWPIHWANWILLPLAITGAILIFQKKTSFPAKRSLWLLPLAWLGWQFASATNTVDASLTAGTLWQFSGCVAAYFLGVFLFGDRRAQHLLIVGILAAFTFCLMSAVDQKLFEFPQNYQMLLEGQCNGWTNFPPDTVAEMKNENIIVTTNGLDMANPGILKKFEKGRVAGTLVYPNALAGLILLLFPMSLALASGATKNLKKTVRSAVILLAIFLGGAAFFWTGSKLGWLLGLFVAGMCLLRLDWPQKLKIISVAAVLIFGLGIFAVRFHNYFSAGATSVGARFDYWRAAVQTTIEKPLFGTGPGTFQHPYERIKSPQAEMARLAHNDYLEQFSDSGIVGGLAFALWIFLALQTVGEKFWRSKDEFAFPVFAGLLAWFAQSFGEFGFYIPALAWTAFTLLGASLTANRIEFDNKTSFR